MSELRTNKIYPRDGLPAGASGGGIIQVVTSECIWSGIQLTTTSWTSLASEGATATITPHSASNKIEIYTYVPSSTVANQATFYNIWDGTDFVTGTGTGSDIHISSATYNSSTATDWAPIPVWYLHSPATTSPVTYTLYCKPSGTSTTDFGWNGNSRYPFVLREVSG